MKTTFIAALSAALLLCAGAVRAADSTADCEKQAADKKLAGAAKNSFVKKCSGGGAPAAKSSAAEACDKTAAEKKLAGAAKNSFVKKCVKDAEGGASAAPAASAAKKKA